MNAPLHLWLIPLLPFAGFLINGILGGRLPRWLVTLVGLLAPLGAFAVVLNDGILAYLHVNPGFAPNPFVETCPFPWISVGALHVDFSFVLDQLSMIMLLVITGVGFLIHIYSVGYMRGDKGYARFFSYLNLFLFFMTTLVLAGNVLLMFVGWEGVGLASYLLIGFWYQKTTAADAGKKAFVVNRVGDFGFLIGIFLLLAHFGTLTFSEISAKLAASPAWTGGALTAICLCLLVGAAGKSAQLPLYVWLPDAMEGPTPVSALIHAATMVTAGVYMIARTHFLYDRSPAAMATVAIVGAATALFAATMSLVQNDIKRVLAYSTISQLGYMFLACGVAAYSAAIFHLVTHAFFKALLFLAAGSVIHALGGEQDMRKMGGLWKKIPITFVTMTAAVIAICGIWPFAGFYSKDAILYAAFLHGTSGEILWFVGLVTALLTALYMFRLWYMTFFGEPRAHEAHPHESPWVMLGPLVILGALCVCGGWIGRGEGLGWIGAFLRPAIGPYSAESTVPHLEWILSGLALGVAVLGFLVASAFYAKKTDRPSRLAAAMPVAYKLVANKYYVDEIYGAIFVKGLFGVSKYLLNFLVDAGILGGAAWLLGGVANLSGAILQRWQSGNLRSYAAWLTLGAVVVLVFALLAGHSSNFAAAVHWAGH
jgi:NADH-quinone oxidoreductase subunit L